MAARKSGGKSGDGSDSRSEAGGTTRGVRKSSERTAAGKKPARKRPSKSAATNKPSAKETAGKKPSVKKTTTTPIAGKAPARKTATKRAPSKKTSARKVQDAQRPGRPAARPTAGKPKAGKPKASKATAGKAAARAAGGGRKTAHPVFGQAQQGGSRVGARTAARTASRSGARLGSRTPVGWRAMVARLRAFGAQELQQLRAGYQPAALAIRIANETDHSAIDVLLGHAFGSSGECRLVRALRADGDMLCELVGEYHGVVIGHIAFARLEAVIDGRNLNAAALAPVAVESAFRGLGVGRRLIAAGLPEARKSGADAVFVLGDPDYYGRFGFSREAAQRFASPYDALFMSVIEFEPGKIAGQSGALTYPPAFAQTDTPEPE